MKDAIANDTWRRRYDFDGTNNDVSVSHFLFLISSFLLLERPTACRYLAGRWPILAYPTMISIELWRARIGQFNRAKCHSGRSVFCFSFLFYPYSGSRRRKNDVSPQEKDQEPLIAAFSTASSPAEEVLSTDTLPDPARPPLQAASTSSCSSTLLSLLPSSYSSGVLQCRSVLREALIILLIAIISQQLLLSASDVETNPGPVACEYSSAYDCRQLMWGDHEPD